MTTDLRSAFDRFLEQMLRQKEEEKYSIKHDATGTPISVGYSHGPGGLLSFPGTDPDVFHTIMGNKSLLGQLPTKPSLYTNPTYYTITGVQDRTGSEKTDPCDNAPTAGLMKGCLLTSVFGRYENATPELELNRLGQRNDRADPMDLRMIGSPIHGTGLFTTGIGNPAEPADLFINEVSRKFWELGIAFHRQIAGQLWNADPANNSAGGGYKEMTGFAQLINTGHVDIETGNACASLDSIIRNFASARLDSNCDTAVQVITDILFHLDDRANRTGLTPVRYVLAMRQQLFYELTRCWPCSYLTYRCQVTGNEQVQVNAEAQRKMQDEMWEGRYLLVDGKKIEVVLDDGIAETEAAAGCFDTDIYFIPMSVIGGQAVTYLEYFEYQNPSMQDALSNMILGRGEGAFFVWPRQTNQCVVWQAKIEPRLVLRTPWLAARLQNVRYCPIQHLRDTFPADSYHVDGGRTSRSGPSYYSLWQD